MSNVIQKFYEQVYPSFKAKKKQPVNKQRILNVLYNMLRRFEIYREDVVYNLLPKGGKYLDIGCGEGNLIFKSLDKFNLCIGVDIAKTRLKLAESKIKSIRLKANQRVKFLFADTDQKLPFANNYFDAVTMVATLEHFFDPYFVISETRRVLKNNGILVIQVPNLGFLPHRLAILFGNLPQTSDDETGWDGGHLHYFTVNSLKDLVTKYNFNVEKITCSGVIAKFRTFWVSLLGADIIISAEKR